MLLTAWATFALTVWIVLWSLGAKALDAMLLVLGIMSVAALLHIGRDLLPGNRG